MKILNIQRIIYEAGNNLEIDMLQTIQNIKLCLGLHTLTITRKIHRLSQLNYLEDRRNSQSCSLCILKRIMLNIETSKMSVQDGLMGLA